MKLRMATELTIGGVVCLLACALCLVVLWILWPAMVPAQNGLDTLCLVAFGVVAFISFAIGSLALCAGLSQSKEQATTSSGKPMPSQDIPGREVDK